MYYSILLYIWNFFLTQPWDFPPLSAALPMAPVQKTKQSNMRLNGPKRCVKNESRSWLQKANSFGILGLYISISARLCIFQGWCYVLCQTAKDVKIWFITLSWILLVRRGKRYIRIRLWVQILTFSLCLCDLVPRLIALCGRTQCRWWKHFRLCYGFDCFGSLTH